MAFYEVSWYVCLCLFCQSLFFDLYSFIQFYTEGVGFWGVGVINHILHQPNLHSLTVPSTIILIDFLNIFLHLCSYIYNGSLCRCYWIGWKDMDHFWNGWDTFTLIFISSFPGNIQRHTSMLIYNAMLSIVTRHLNFLLRNLNGIRTDDDDRGSIVQSGPLMLMPVVRTTFVGVSL